MAQRIQVRRGTAADATTANPVLAAGEIGFETDTGKAKIGDGVTAWTSLDYFGGAGGSGTLTESSVTGTTTLTTAAFGTVVVCSGTTSDYTVTLPTAVENAGNLLRVRMSPALTRLVTLDGNAAETIGGAATRVMWSGEAVTLISDGTNWGVLSQVARPLAAVMRRSFNQTGIANATQTVVQLDQTDGDNSGLMADTSGNQIVIRRAGIYRVSAVLPYDSSPAASRRWICQLVKNGANSMGGEVSAYTNGTYPSPVVTGDLPLAVGDTLKVAAYQESGGAVAVYGSAGGTAVRLDVHEVI